MVSPVHVVGYGIIDALGNNPKECFSNMVNDQDYIQQLPFMVDKDEKHTVGLVADASGLCLPDISPKLIKTFTESQKFAFHVVEQALKMSGLPLSKNVAVIVSSTANDSEGGADFASAMVKKQRINPRKAVNRIPDMMPAHICTHYGFMGASVSLYASCATGLYTIDYAQRLCDEYDYVIAGAADRNMCYEPVKFFSVVGALGTHNSPFDDNRDGFIMSDGAGCLILQSSKKVEEFGSTIHATLYPAGCSSDALDMTAPDPDGKGAKMAIEKALKNADMHITDSLFIDAVSAHATSTIVGDPIEYKVITENLGKVPIYAPKSKIGHSIGAASIVETIYAIESMKNNTIPHCQNLVSCSFDEHDCIVKTPMQYPNQLVKRTLNNSFGFGGKCVSQVIEVS
jgi:3-oxoacyl-[acyl-carrier-protein] synthase II